MTNDGFQLEELENAAVKKSNSAKRAAAIGATVAGSGAIGVAGKSIYDNSATQNDGNGESLLSEDDVENVANTGANQVDATQPDHEESAPATPKASAPTVPHHQVSTTQNDDEIDISFEKTTHYYDEDNNLLLTTEEGKVEGHNFMLGDVDGDMQADILAYDANNNGAYEENEFVELEGRNQIGMGNPTYQHDDIFLATRDPEPYPVEPIDDPYYDINEEKGYADNGDNIHNDFEDEKTGEIYRDDYAENSQNYNNNGDVDQYSSAHADLAYKEDDIINDDEYEEEFDDLASNDIASDDADDIVNDDFIDIA